MTDRSVRLSTLRVMVVAAVLGILIGVADVVSPFGDDSGQFSVFLLLVCSGVLGFARPHQAWRWAIAIGPGLPLTQLVCHALGWISPGGHLLVSSIVLLLGFSVGVCLVGAYGGALARRVFRPPVPHGAGIASRGFGRP
jgi:hypothetical protein